MIERPFELCDPFDYSRLYDSEKYSLQNMLLKTVKEAGGLAVAVDNGEGCSVEAMQNANIFVVGIVNALDLLVERTWCKATLRR